MMELICSIGFLAGLFTACGHPGPLAVGYVEGEYVLLAPIETARVVEVAVRRGENVKIGQRLATLEREDAEIAVAQTEAALAEAKARLADLKRGKRTEEIAVLEAQLRSAAAELAEARRSLQRIRDLFGRGIATQAELERAETAVELAEARLGQAEANLAVAKLPPREDAVEAAENQVMQAKATLEHARWRLERRTITAPAAGRIDDVLRNAGDMAGPTAPVLSLLPDGAVKLKLYVPQPQFFAIRLGDQLEVRCEGCPAGLTARVSYASPDPEFTPPVIFSLEIRQKLVHLVEARPEGGIPLKPGQIVDVVLAE
jgi:HlyD family secretion protein